MANKIYNFLPAHLRNSELESIFDATLERAFSKGSMQKEKAFLGRKEKGIYSDKDVYMSFPEHLFQRDNYGLEPVFSNTKINDNVYYDDLLNAMFNKGMLTNDHRRLFKSKSFTVNLPIDADKFANWSLYYWVSPEFFTDDYIFETPEGESFYPYYKVESEHKHYITIEKVSDENLGNWWSNNNAWYHYDDIREFITSDNKQFIEQATRPIIEFDARLTISNSSVTEWEVPKFVSDDGNAYSIFEYVSGDNYPLDIELGFSPKLKAGDYHSEYVFNIDLPQGVKFELDSLFVDLYTECNFNYRNLRHEVGTGAVDRVELTQAALSENDIDVYVDGIKQIGNYTYSNSAIEFDKTVEGYVYIDYATADNVVVDGDFVWQRIDPSIEYNTDNEYHNLKEMTYSTVYEHMIRLIETTDGLTGEANGVNNFRQLGDNTEKTRFNNLGSVLVRNSIDIKKAYFAVTRDDYDPVKSVEFLSSAYNSYKNKLVTVVRGILEDTSSDTKTTTEILDQAIKEISLTKRSSISVFDGTTMINFGENLNHYTDYDVIIDTTRNDILTPDELITLTPDITDINVYVNDKLKINNIDYAFTNLVNVEFTTVLQPGDIVTFRHFEIIQQTFIPPSSTKLGINALYAPDFPITDTEYETDVEMIRGHDGSLMPAYSQLYISGELVVGTEYEIVDSKDTDFTLIGAKDNNIGTKFIATGVGTENGVVRLKDRTDDIILEFETLIYNRITSSESDDAIKHFDYGIYRDATTEYSIAEKKYTQYPFFKKWMIRNNIDNLYNDTFDPDNWKTWNYRSINEQSPGHWRGILQYVYGTDNPVVEPWVTVGLSQKPDGFDVHGIDYTTTEFWENLKTAYNKDWPVPIDSNGQIIKMDDLFFGGAITTAEISTMDQDWEFGDGSPVEMAWRRSSEYAFAEFLLMILTKPFEVLDNYATQVDNIISYYHAREGYVTTDITKQREQYEFKLGSKLGGFVNNFKLLTENSSLSNSNYTDIPSDNYDLFVHAGEPNRSESFSAIVVEKVSTDVAYPTYDMNDTATYNAGDIVLNPYDHKYYKRKTTGESAKETANSIKFDYTMWTLISQPKTREFGYRIHGYDDYNPMFFTLDWDKTSKKKVWSTDGDAANINVWTTGEYYKQDSYTVYNNKPYVSLVNHTASSLFDNDIKNWKLLPDWPRVNKVEANGYSETLLDQIKSYNYGDILNTRDEVAQLMVGYQSYLKAIGWDFTDLDEDNRVVDFERLLEKFLDWSAEVHQPGDFITLTPILLSGSFEAPYGVAAIGRETNKNYYRVVDENGRQLPDTEITFNSDGSKITWESRTPVYGIKLDVADIEQAFVVDRVDSYGDVIYDPFSHNRNLRMIVDCNRTTDWDGTLAADGYIVYENELVPNLETMVGETRYYRDTIVDQSLKNINNLKSNQIGYSPRTYLTNHGAERESQLEFYKGFLAGKSTVSSINKIINFNSNFEDLKHRDMWAIKIADYGKLDNNLSVSSTVNTIDIVSDPHVVHFDMDNKIPTVDLGKRVAIKTAGYVDPSDVNYVVQDSDTLVTSALPYYEGDLAWVRFDAERDWDVKRLSEVAEINFIGETSDGQLRIALTNEVSTSETVYLKIINGNVDPEIQGNYYLVSDGTRVSNGLTVYEYLVFDQTYEPLIVEIDTTTDNSVYIPTSGSVGVEAIGYVSNPTFLVGDKLSIDTEVFTYTPGTGSTSTGISIGGSGATADPIVSEGEQVRIVVYGNDGLIANTNTLVTFSGTNATATQSVVSEAGDKIDIDGETVTIDYSAVQSIRAESTATTTTDIDSGKELDILSNGNQDKVTFRDIEVVGTIANPTIDATTSIRINGVTIDFTVPVTPADIIETFTGTNNAPSNVVENITGVSARQTYTISQALSPTTYSINTVTVDGSSYVETTDWTISGQDITFVNPTFAGGESIVITLTHVEDLEDTFTLATTLSSDTYSILSVTVDGNTSTETTDWTLSGQDITFTTAPESGANVEIILTHNIYKLDTQDIVYKINSSGIPENAIIDSSGFIVINSPEPYVKMTGAALLDMGFSASSIIESKLANIADDLNSLTYLDSYISGDVLIIETDENELTLSGTAFNDLGFPSNTYETNSNPTASSIAQQINSLSIPNITASVVVGKLKISSNSASILIEENSSTPGSMLRLGFEQETPILVNSIDSIITDLNTALSDLPNTKAQEFDRRVLITSDESSIVLNNITGNAWSDLGIATGNYSNTNTLSSSAAEFKEQINDASDNVTVNISSDGRMIFTSENNTMTFSGTTQAMLDKIGLVTEYTSVTSNADFKVMRWKSVRFTPNYNGDDFDVFYESLGLNDTSLMWADEYLNSGWAVIERDEYGALNILNRRATPINTDYVNRIVAKSGDEFYDYQLFDPINFKIAGSIAKDIDYVDWNDPAKYDITLNNELWLSQSLGKIWWDTNLTRYYRYDDYGDANGNIDIDYAKRFWGKLVPGSEVVVKQWVTSEKLPDGISQFNTETYFDSIRNKEVTKYYYWISTGDEARYSKEFSVEEITMMISSPTTVNKFFPINNDTVIISNNANILTSNTITYSIEYRTDDKKEKHHTDWELVSRNSHAPLDDMFLQDFKNSIANSKILHYEQFEKTEPSTVDYEYNFTSRFIPSQNDFVITVNNQILSDSTFSIEISENQEEDNKFTNKVTLFSTAGVLEGDVVRIYHISEYDSWFTNITEARDNFASSILSTLSKRMIATDFPMYKDYIVLDHGIFATNNWYHSEKYETIETFEYLSRTRNIDMIALYKSGISSFKVELPDVDEYYFPVDGEIRLVHKTNSVLDLDFSTGELTANQISVQLHELMNMIYEYAEVSEIKSVFFDMIEYMYTERTHPDWIFKTSYIDLTMFNKPLRQYAIYQRDSYQDTIDYVMETKPYHTKIRKTERIYPTNETADLTVDALHHTRITKFFGEHSRFELNAIDGGSSFTNTWGDPLQSEIEQYDPLSNGTYQGGKFLRNTFDNSYNVKNIEVGKEYLILNPGDTDFSLICLQKINNTASSIIKGTRYKIIDAGNTEFTLIGADDNNTGTIFTADWSTEENPVTGTGIVTAAGTSGDIFVATGVGTGTGIVFDTKLYNVSNNLDGFDTGQFNARALEAAIVTVNTYSESIVGLTKQQIKDKIDQKIIDLLRKEFYVYDRFGRGYHIPVVDNSTLSSFDGEILIVDPDHANKFKSAKAKTKRLIAIEDSIGNIEFMMYDDKSTNNLRISNRAVYNGVATSVESGNKIYVMSSPVQIYSHENT